MMTALHLRMAMHSEPTEDDIRIKGGENTPQIDRTIAMMKQGGGTSMIETDISTINIRHIT
jgi:hypothetical protein